MDTVGKIHIAISVNGSSFDFAGLNISSSTWYVRDVGMVKTSDAAGGVSADLVLIDSSLLD